MKKYYYYLFGFISIIITPSYSQHICIKADIGLEKLTAYPSTLEIEDKEYNAINIFDQNICYGLSFYLKKYQNIDIGLTYSHLAENIDKSNFPAGYHLSGQEIINKFGMSFLFGKTFKSKYHPYFILEPSYYYVEDNTDMWDTTGMTSSAGCIYTGNNFIGSGIGFGFDYYYNRYIGLSASARFDIGMAFSSQVFFISYPSIQIGVLFSY